MIDLTEYNDLKNEMWADLQTQQACLYDRDFQGIDYWQEGEGDE